MGFDVIPAVDVSGGRLSRWSPQGVVPVDAFGGDPLAAAASFRDAGAALIHVVDLDLAVQGEFRNLRVVRDISALGVPVQASGGIGDRRRVEEALAAGASRVVLGSGALPDRVETEAVMSRHGEVVAVGLEVDGDVIRPRGGGDLPLVDTVAWLSGLGVRRFVHTDVRRAGTLLGPDLAGIGRLVSLTDRPVLAAAGVRDVDDLRAVAAAGAEGAIVGRALYEGLDLADALRAFA